MTDRPDYVEIAPAKINLALHVRGRRADGRHDLETVFAFCTDGDKLTASDIEHTILDRVADDGTVCTFLLHRP